MASGATLFQTKRGLVVLGFVTGAALGILGMLFAH